VRKLLVGLVVASVALALLGSAADAREGIRRSVSSQGRGGPVTYTVTTTCPFVFLRSHPGGPHTALEKMTKRVFGGSVTFSENVRTHATVTKDKKPYKKPFKVAAYCKKKRRGRIVRTIASTKLHVTSQIAFGGAPILPQLLLAAGLIGTGGLLLILSRRRRLGPEGRRAAWRRAGAPGGRWA
jgi:hypothetical protein